MRKRMRTSFSSHPVVDDGVVLQPYAPSAHPSGENVETAAAAMLGIGARVATAGCENHGSCVSSGGEERLKTENECSSRSCFVFVAVVRRVSGGEAGLRARSVVLAEEGGIDETRDELAVRGETPVIDFSKLVFVGTRRTEAEGVTISKNKNKKRSLPTG